MKPHKKDRKPHKKSGRKKVVETLDDIRQVMATADVIEIGDIEKVLREKYGDDFEMPWDWLTTDDEVKERVARDWSESDKRIDVAWLLKRQPQPFNDPPEAAPYRPTSEEWATYVDYVVHGVPAKIKADKKLWARFRKRIERTADKVNRYLLLFAVYSVEFSDGAGKV